MCKAALRRIILEERGGISEEEARVCGEGIAALVFAETFWRDAASVFCFIGTGGEPDTSPIIRGAFAEGKTVFVPRTLKSAGEALVKETARGCDQRFPGLETVPVMSEMEYGRATAEWPRSFGIPEPPASYPAADPISPCLVIVPSLAVDRLGFRLGYGGGYYDRFIAQSRAATKPPLFAAIQYAAFLRESPLPREAHDMRVDIIATEKEIIIPSS